MELDTFDSLRVGELDGENDEIRTAIGELSVSLTSDGASQIDFAVHDPGFEMHNNGYFVVRRLVHWDELTFETAAVEVDAAANSADTVRVTARSPMAQKLKRDTGSANFGKISPTQFAKQMAAKHGLGFFGESSAAKEAIIRTQNDTTDESSWDVLKRLASDLKFSAFDDGTIFYFASEKFIISKQPVIDVSWPRDEDSPYPLHSVRLRRSDDDPIGSEIDLEIDRTNATQLRPGMAIFVNGFDFFDKPHMITSVEFDVNTPRPVRVTARTPEDSPDIGCERRTFRIGMEGPCVQRIQKVVLGGGRGVFGPVTEQGVKDFQASKGLPVTGVVDSDTWKAIIAS